MPDCTERGNVRVAHLDIATRGRAAQPNAAVQADEGLLERKQAEFRSARTHWRVRLFVTVVVVTHHHTNDYAFDEVSVRLIDEQRDPALLRIHGSRTPKLAKTIGVVNQALAQSVFHTNSRAFHQAAQGHGIGTEVGREFHEVGKLADILFHAHK